MKKCNRIVTYFKKGEHMDNNNHIINIKNICDIKNINIIFVL